MPGSAARVASLAILVCDDEARFRAMLEECLREEGHRVATAGDGPSAVARLSSGEVFDLVITDMRMPGVGGFAVLEAAKAAPSSPAVVAITGFASIDETVLAIRHGATDYLAKPFPLARLLEVVATIARTRDERKRQAPPPRSPERTPAPRGASPARALQPEPDADDGTYCGFVGASEAMRAVYARLLRFAPLDATVLIQGETGTGKELAAAALHDLSPRKRGPLVRVNCANIDRSLFESALFGHVRGAFTGAVAEKEGLFHAAAHGTIFLDEVGEIPLDLQPKLLRAIERKEFLRVGGTAPERVDVRIVAASNRDLEIEASRGRFREDLYFRLSGFILAMPPLRERSGDIALLVRHHLDRFAREQNREPLTLSANVAARCEAYEWPGNVRELENTMRVIVACSTGPVVEVADLPPRFAGVNARSTSVRPGAVAEAVAPATETLGCYHDARDRVLGEFERRYFGELAASGGSLSAAARRAGLDRKSLRQKLRRLGLTLPGALASGEAAAEDDATAPPESEA